MRLGRHRLRRCVDLSIEAAKVCTKRTRKRKKEEEIFSTYNNRIACHAVASAKILDRLNSTFVALVPTSATLIENNGLRVATAMVSAVDVLPTPGGPVHGNGDIRSFASQPSERGVEGFKRSKDTI